MRTPKTMYVVWVRNRLTQRATAHFVTGDVVLARRAFKTAEELPDIDQIELMPYQRWARMPGKRPKGRRGSQMKGNADG